MRKYLIDTVNKTVIFDFNYDENIIESIKQCSYNSRWNPELMHWIIPIDEYSKSRIINLIKNYNFIKAEAKVVDYEKYDYSIPKESMEKLYAMCKKLKWTPRDYQLEALAYTIEKRSAIIGDDVGVGKTFEAIMYVEAMEALPCIVVVPASVKYNWAEKWKEIVGDKRTISTIETKETKTRKNNWDADVVIINYDIIGKKQGTGATVKFPELTSIEWKSAVYDEAHFLKNTSSQRSKAAAKIIKKIDRRLLLTGTATMNKPVELWNLLKLVGKSDDIADDWVQFVTRYCGGYKGKFGWVTDGATNTLELNKLLRDTCYIRREKRDVLKELPGMTKQILNASIANSKKYKFAENDFINFIRQTQGDEKAEKAQEAEHLVMIGQMRKLTIEGKLKAIEQYLKDWREAGNGKLVIFGLHREQLNYLSKKFKSTLVADVSAKEKHRIIKDWCNSDENFIFGNMETMGTGVDGLQYVCSNMLIIELPWRPSDLDQAIGRLDRSGQTIPVTVTFILADETIDSDMWKMLSEKEAITEAVNKGIDVRRNKSGLKNVMKRMLKRTKK